MKTNFLKSIFYSLLAVTFITSCANDDDYNAPNLICEDQTEGLTANISGADLYAMATASLQQFSVEGNDYLEGYITSSDRGGNFFKTVSIETTDGRGLSIAVDIPNTYTKGYQVGRKVLIKLNGLHYKIKHSSLSLGEKYGSDDTGRIAENKVKNHVFFSCDFKSEEELTHKITIGQAKNNNYINKLIQLGDEFEENENPDDLYFVEFTETGVPYYSATDPNTIGGATNRTLTDKYNNTLYFRTGSFAVYSGKIIPAKSGRVTGVMTKFNNDFQFVARDSEDIVLDQPSLSEQQPEPEIPGDPENLLFNGADFENWTIFNSSINSFGLQSYAVQGVGTGVNSSNSLHINGTPTANDYVYTILASAQGNIPDSPSKITFWIKGTSSAKSLSINVYRSNAGTAYDVFNLSNVGTTPLLLTKASLNAQGNGSNSYGGTINTEGQWVKVTLMISDVNLNTGTNGNLFALKVGSNSVYDLHIDNIEIE